MRRRPIELKVRQETIVAKSFKLSWQQESLWIFLNISHIENYENNGWMDSNPNDTPKIFATSKLNSFKTKKQYFTI